MWTSFQNRTIISLKSRGHVQGVYWLSGSANGVNLHSNKPLVVSLRCIDCENTEQVWLTGAHDNEIRFGESAMYEGARWNAKRDTKSSYFFTFKYKQW